MTKTVAERLREIKGASLPCRGDILAFALGRKLDCPIGEDCINCIGRLASELADTIEAERAHAVSKALSGAEPQLPAGVIWPRFEDGELVNFGDEFLNNRDNTATVTRIALSEKHFTINKGQGRICKTYGNRIKRPEPEVLDADGVPIKVGDMVYHGHHVPLEVTKVCADGVWLNLINGKAEVRIDPHALTHRKPDTQEDIDDDAAKDPCAYFNGRTPGKCADCKLHDDDPDFDFETNFNDCRTAMNRDLLARQRKMLGGE